MNKTTLACALALCALEASAVVKLPGYITDNMVVQRNNVLTVNGTAAPGSKVTATPEWSGKAVTAKAEKDGRFTLQISTPDAGGPWSMDFTDKDGTVTVGNVLSGEVWICSGQSNMEFPINGWGKVMGYDEVIPQAVHPDLRLLQIARHESFGPESDTPVSFGGWVECDPDNVQQFSAIGYFYGLRLLEELGVPVGMIDSSWGGTPAEAWTSLGYLKGIPGFETHTAYLEKMMKENTDVNAAVDADVKQYEKNIAEQSKKMEEEALANGFKPGMSSSQPWERTILPGYDGAVWVRKFFDVPAELAGKPLTLSLGIIDDEDITYLNGKEVGRTSGWNKVRTYKVPGGVLKAGRNEVRIRINDLNGDGGFAGGKLYAEVDKSIFPIDGDWDYVTAIDLKKFPVHPMGGKRKYLPTALFNAMINPITAMPVRGVIWYQGCANVGRAEQYEPLFQNLIKNWREAWGNPCMPFYFVQLAGFRKPSFCQPGSEWAALRNAQAKALALPNTGMAVAIDLGQPYDIHPRNKQDVARRLSNIALARDYGKTVDYKGPAPVASEVKDGKIIITFDSDVRPVAAVTGFIIGDKDGKFAQAHARLTSPRTVELSSSRIKNPVEARYDWADYPDGNLYGANGLPVAPFSTAR